MSMFEEFAKPNPKKVFVVHGRNEKLRIDLFSFLRAIQLDPIEFSEAIKLTGKAAPYIGEILDTAFENAQAVIVLMSPDDEARLRAEFIKEGDSEYEKHLTPQPRQNVLFEAGLAFGYKPDRTILVKVGEVRPFSDIYGRHEVRLTNDAAKRQELVNRLSTAGCDVETKGTDWLKVGNFNMSSSITPGTTKLSMPEAEKIALDYVKKEKPEATDLTISARNLEDNNWHIRGDYPIKDRIYSTSMYFEIVIDAEIGNIVSNDFRIGLSK